MTAAQARAPFLDFSSFSVEESEAPSPELRPFAPQRSPFLSIYELHDGESAADDPLREAYAALVDELHDEEFDEALFELQCHGRALHDRQLATGTPRADADRVVTQHFAPLLREADAALDAMAREFAPREQAGIVEGEIDSFVQAYAPSAALEPEFEQFLGKLIKKVGRAAKAAAGKAWQGLKKIGLGAFFNRIKAFVKPLLNAVLQKAIGKLPQAVQPIARQLAQKLGFGAAAAPAQPAADAAAPSGAGADAGSIDAAADAAGSPVQPAAGDDAITPQQELDEQIASALLAQDEVEFQLEAAFGAASRAAIASPVFAELEDARERFIHALESLADDESAAPHVEQFLPALLPALKVGLRLAGRQRVVNFLAQLLAKLIGKLVGPQHATALSRAIVDAGLKLVNLELSEAETARLAPAAVAATVEEAIGRVASLPDYVLDNQELLEGFALEAFEHAAAANLPAVFSEATYRRRPDLLEAGVNAAWVLLPLRGPKRYKRCTRVFKVSVSPHMADEVESFEGSALAEHLQDRLGLDEGEQVEAELHLYEALPGTTLTDIARGEQETLGPGLSDEANAAQLHPLTPQAASALLGKPGLGRTAPAGSIGTSLAAGQRLYHLALGRRPLMMPGRRARMRRLLHLNLTLDDVQGQLRACAFISEVKAQRLATRLRQGSNLGLVTAGFERAIGRRLHRILRGEAPARLRVVHAAMRPGQSPALALQNLPALAVQTFTTKLRSWLAQAFAEFIKTQSARMIAATEDAADGITLAFTIEQPPGLKALGSALVGQNVSGSAIAEAIAKGAAPTVRVEVHAGHRCG